jgi:hypothetical protein
MCKKETDSILLMSEELKETFLMVTGYEIDDEETMEEIFNEIEL